MGTGPDLHHGLYGRMSSSPPPGTAVSCQKTVAPCSRDGRIIDMEHNQRLLDGARHLMVLYWNGCAPAFMTVGKTWFQG